MPRDKARGKACPATRQGVGRSPQWSEDKGQHLAASKKGGNGGQFPPQGEEKESGAVNAEGKEKRTGGTAIGKRRATPH